MSEQAGASGEESVSGELGERVRTIVAAAESMAAAVRSDADAYAEARRREADAEAERRLREASEQAEALLSEQLARVRELEEDVARALREVTERAGRGLGGTGTAEAGFTHAEVEEEHPMAEEVRPLRPPGERDTRPLRPVAPPEPPRGDDETRLDDARLVALQMAVAGRSRDEVSAHLRKAFDVPDPDPILDHVFAEGFPPRHA